MIASIKKLVLVAPLFALGCTGKPSKEECEKLLAHVVDLYTPVQPGETLTPQMKKDLESQKQAVREQVGKSFLSQCEDSLPGEQVRCGLKAKTPEELAKCEE